MVKITSLIERAEYFRARALEVRRIASTLPDENVRETLRSIADDYDRLAKAQDQLILAKSNIALLAPDDDARDQLASSLDRIEQTRKKREE